MILPTDEFGFSRGVTKRRAGGGVVEENSGGNFVVRSRRGPGPVLRDSGDAGQDPEGGIKGNKCVRSEMGEGEGKGRIEGGI